MLLQTIINRRGRMLVDMRKLSILDAAEVETRSYSFGSNRRLVRKTDLETQRVKSGRKK